jgi:hypothetical protein
MYEKCVQNSCQHLTCITLFNRFIHKALQPQRTLPATSIKMLPHSNKVQSVSNGKIQSEIKLGAYFHSKYLVFVTKGHTTGNTK